MVGKYDCQFLYYSFVQTEWIFIKTWGWHKFFSGNHQNTSFLLSILRHIASPLLFFILLLLIINRPSLVLLLDHEHDGEDREAAEGEDVAEPLDPNVRDGEDAKEDHTDDVVPGGNHNDSRISRMRHFSFEISIFYGIGFGRQKKCIGKVLDAVSKISIDKSFRFGLEKVFNESQLSPYVEPSADHALADWIKFLDTKLEQ